MTKGEKNRKDERAVTKSQEDAMAQESERGPNQS
jgi:hypothetical protein